MSCSNECSLVTVIRLITDYNVNTIHYLIMYNMFTSSPGTAPTVRIAGNKTALNATTTAKFTIVYTKEFSKIFEVHLTVHGNIK